MPVLGIGVDIVETARFGDKRRSMRFYDSIFTESERRYCLAKLRPEEHFAARFAAKEATCKAYSAAGLGFLSVAEVEVIRVESGAPKIGLRPGRHGQIAPALPSRTIIHVSVSHSQRYATATVIIEAI